MRGELCISLASLLSLTSMILLALIYAGQTNSSSVAGSISMARIDLSSYHEVLFSAFEGVIPIEGLYASDGASRLGNGTGLRHEYRFGVTNYCGYVESENEFSGRCARQATASQFRPFSIIKSDMPLNYSQFINAVVPPSNFRNDVLLGSFSRTAGYMFLLAFIFVGLSLILGLAKVNFTFLLSTLFSILSCIFLLLGAILWTVAVKKAQVINGMTITTTPVANPTPIGIEVSLGVGLKLAWAAFGLMMAANIPYLISCCTYRG
ncbi:hypothetical protein CC2G_011257 [Coprinopsis cinerea AmutBmut pab1-1]|nr:hypothetical protein CC2G_011257 [Coprinopsis cinerea AmutBmut pab1-1]